MSDTSGTECLRIDRLLCYLRICRTRSVAQTLIAKGYLRCNGQRVIRPSMGIRPGDIVTAPIGQTVRVFEVLTLPERRGPPSEAQSHYRWLDLDS